MAAEELPAPTFQMPSLEDSEAVYDRFVKPLEAEHYGRYIAVLPDGRYVLGDDLTEVVQLASAEFDQCAFAFKIGPRIVAEFTGFPYSMSSPA